MQSIVNFLTLLKQNNLIMKAIRPLKFEDIVPGAVLINEDRRITVIEETPTKSWRAKSGDINTWFFAIDIPFYSIELDLPDRIHAVDSKGAVKLEFILDESADYDKICYEVIERKKIKSLDIHGFKFALYRNNGELVLVSEDLQVKAIYHPKSK